MGSSNYTTDDALKTFFPGQKFSLTPLDDCPMVTFTVSKLFTPVTFSIAVLARPDAENAKAEEQPEVVVKIHDPRYFKTRLCRHTSPPRLWSRARERAAALIRPRWKNTSFFDDELSKALSDAMCPEGEPQYVASSGDNQTNSLPLTRSESYFVLCEEDYYRTALGNYNTELEAYKRLHDLQGTAIPRFLWAGTLSPPLVERVSVDGPLSTVEERAIRPLALVLEHVPSVSLADIPPTLLTSELCEQVISTLGAFPPRGVIHGDVTLTNIRFSPPTKPVRAVMIDFAGAALKCSDEEDPERAREWEDMGRSDAWWAGVMMEERRTGKRDASRR